MWSPIKEMPKDGKFYPTKIDDYLGVRKVHDLKLQSGLFFTRGGMYVYYTPTHFFKS